MISQITCDGIRICIVSSTDYGLSPFHLIGLKAFFYLAVGSRWHISFLGLYVTRDSFWYPVLILCQYSCHLF